MGAPGDKPLQHGAAPPAGPDAPTPLPPALAHLFRHSLREGRIHPLMPLLQRYREQQQHPATDSGSSP